MPSICIMTVQRISLDKVVLTTDTCVSDIWLIPIMEAIEYDIIATHLEPMFHSTYR